MSTEAKQHKSRINIILSEETLALGKKLAADEKRSFSNLLEVLVLREVARQTPIPALSEKAEVGA